MKLLTKAFQDQSGTCYLYDAITNKVFNISSRIYQHYDKLCRDLEQNSLSSGDSSYIREVKFFKDHVHRGFLGENTLESVGLHFDSDILEENIRTNIRMLILEVTQGCNLRCEYCIYSGNYENFRTHTSKSMSADTAFKALEFYKKHSSHQEKTTVSFYGGEPLTAFDTVVKAIEYGRKIFGNKPQHYYITTNGTLLNREIIRWFLSQKDVILNITLNGDKTFHDTFRRFPGGAPTYDLILSSLSDIKKQSPKAYTERVNLICNYFDWKDVKTIHEAYKQHKDLVPKAPGAVTGIKKSGIRRGPVSEELETVSSHPEVLAELFNEYIRELKKGTGEKTLLKALFDKMLYPYYIRPMDKFLKTACLISACQPMANRLFVDTDGNFNLCERSHRFADFGNVSEGICSERVQVLLEKFKRVREKHCLTCWALRFCPICYKDVFSTGIHAEIDGNMCSRIRENVLQSLKMYCGIMAVDEKLLKHLELYNQ